MAKLKTIVEVPDGDYCIERIPFNQEEKCIMLGYSCNYCKLFKERLALDWKNKHNGLFLQPIKCPQCIEAEVEK